MYYHYLLTYYYVYLISKWQYKAAGLPNIAGWFSSGNNYGYEPAVDNSLFKLSGSVSAVAAHYALSATKISMNVANINSIYGNSTTNQPKSLYLVYIIKY